MEHESSSPCWQQSVPVSILSQLTPSYVLPKVYFNIIPHLCLVHPRSLWKLQAKMYSHPTSTMQCFYWSCYKVFKFYFNIAYSAGNFSDKVVVRADYTVSYRRTGNFLAGESRLQHLRNIGRPIVFTDYNKSIFFPSRQILFSPFMHI